MKTSDGALDPAVVQFVEHHVTSLVAWDILAFFHRSPDAVLDCESLAVSLGRHLAEVEPEVEALDHGGLLSYEAGLVRYKKSAQSRQDVNEFFGSCEKAASRLALIALVLNKMSRNAQ